MFDEFLDQKKKIGMQKIVWIQKRSGQKNLDTAFLGSKTILGPKSFGPKIMLGPKIFLLYKKFCVKTKLCAQKK